MISPCSESVYSNKLLIPVNSERGGGAGGGGRGGARRSPESREGAPQNRDAPLSRENAQSRDERKEVDRNGNEEGNFQI